MSQIVKWNALVLVISFIPWLVQFLIIIYGRYYHCDLGTLKDESGICLIGSIDIGGTFFDWLAGVVFIMMLIQLLLIVSLIISGSLWIIQKAIKHPSEWK